MKLEGAIKLHDYLKEGDVEGKIVKRSYFSLTLESTEGKRISLPYHLVKNTKRVKAHKIDLISSHVFQLEVPKKDPSFETIEKLRIAILTAPWSSINQEPNIQLLQESEQHYSYEIVIYSLEARYFDKIKVYLRKLMLG